ncbi:MAG: TrkH family potassium uptake protein [Bacteroidales bacterium]|nr:TrkH family potassium uptake protein [Bacteroidales bacterium]
MNYRYILNIQGKILLVLSGFMITIIPWIFYFQEQDIITGVILSIIIPLVFGLILIYFNRNPSENIRIKEGYFLVSVVWITLGLAGCLPFYITGIIPSITDALFETISGFTTTGSSILTDIEATPKSILYWRSLTHWIGGMGIIVLVIAILPSLKIAGYQLINIESSSVLSEKIKPRASQVAMRLWGIYVFLTVVLVLLLMLGGVNFYESLCHAFGTIATGGFGTKNDSIGSYSGYVQYMITFFMLLSGMNFTLHYFLFKRQFAKVRNNSELRVYLGIIFIVGISITSILHFSNGLSLEKAFRDSFFQVVSILTATGFATADYMKWTELAWILIFALMFIGASVGSTGGGIKVIRHVIAFKSIKSYFRKLLHPYAVNPIRINDKPVSDDKVNSIITFISIYLIIVLFSMVLMLVMGLNAKDAIGSVLATMGGIGPGIGDVGPAGNYAFIPNAGKIYLSFLMILGRLEILALLIIFTPSFWKR